MTLQQFGDNTFTLTNVHKTYCKC